ncbi:hypothetical protein QJS10_CPA05g00242 [Acorus calamus]|uniref:Uncharacterized protein n=1 Tax=Acorus calamus TaxID=4465 RepID=A0AAV9ESR9_ACOCL|nr:hypothetical protein QJS10_CPA05g00242 [Acorus calamus]
MFLLGSIYNVSLRDSQSPSRRIFIAYSAFRPKYDSAFASITRTSSLTASKVR